jgi:two-component system cell cycle response regulator CtrA
MRILLVKSDPAAARGLQSVLSSARIGAELATQGEEALDLLSTYAFSLVLTELDLPDISGLDVVRRMRLRRDATPVLVLGGNANSTIKARALNLGADDVISGAYDNHELVARIQAIIRRSGGFASSQVRVGNLTVDLGTRDVWVDGVSVRLTEKEFQVLEALVLKKGHVLTKDHFLNYLYGGMDEPDAKIIDVFICKLRKKLANAGGDNLISTVWGRGYVIREPEADTAATPAADGAALLPPPPRQTAALLQA